MSSERQGRRLLLGAAGLAMCCGGAALLTAAGVLGTTGGLLRSPELVIAGVLLAAVAVWRAVARHRSKRAQ